MNFWWSILERFQTFIWRKSTYWGFVFEASSLSSAKSVQIIYQFGWSSLSDFEFRSSMSSSDWVQNWFYDRLKFLRVLTTSTFGSSIPVNRFWVLADWFVCSIILALNFSNATQWSLSRKYLGKSPTFLIFWWYCHFEIAPHFLESFMQSKWPEQMNNFDFAKSW